MKKGSLPQLITSHEIMARIILTLHKINPSTKEIIHLFQSQVFWPERPEPSQYRNIAQPMYCHLFFFLPYAHFVKQEKFSKRGPWVPLFFLSTVLDKFNSGIISRFKELECVRLEGLRQRERTSVCGDHSLPRRREELC